MLSIWIQIIEFLFVFINQIILLKGIFRKCAPYTNEIHYSAGFREGKACKKLVYSADFFFIFFPFHH